VLKPILIALGGALATAFITLVLVAPAARAEAPKCKNQAHKYVACTDKLRAKTGPAARGNVEYTWKVEEGESAKRKPGLKAGK
jgi:hypothetical protein